MPSLDFPPPQDSTVLPLRAAINHSHKPAQSGLRISWQDPRAMEGAAAVQGGERSNICLRPILSFLPPITTSNLCFSLRFRRIFPYQLQTRAGRRGGMGWKGNGRRSEKRKKQKGMVLVYTRMPLFFWSTFSPSASFLPVHVHFSDHLSAVAEVDNKEGGKRLYSSLLLLLSILSSGHTGRRRGRRETREWRTEENTQHENIVRK